MKKAIVTGSSGLIGSEAVSFLDERGWTVHGVDNNMRRDFFGEPGDTAWNLERLRGSTSHFVHHDLDIRDRGAILTLFETERPDLIVHAAAQPSHDLAATRPFDDFDVNAVGTLNLLEAVREHAPEAPFAFLSTNKVYGDAPNEVELVELETRWDYADGRDGIDESCRIDATMHSLFGASKAAADLLVQEYGRYFGLPTACFRAGCLTGASTMRPTERAALSPQSKKLSQTESSCSTIPSSRRCRRRSRSPRFFSSAGPFAILRSRRSTASRAAARCSSLAVHRSRMARRRSSDSINTTARPLQPVRRAKDAATPGTPRPCGPPRSSRVGSERRPFAQSERITVEVPGPDAR